MNFLSKALSPFKFQTKVALIVGWSLLFVSWISSYSIYTVAMQESKHQLGERLKAVAISGALGINGDEHQKLILQPKTIEDLNYQKIRKFLQELRDANKDLRLRYVYTMIPADKKGLWQYVVDSEPIDSQYFSFPGESEDNSYDKRWVEPISEPFADHKLRPYRDWGTMLSASAPIRDKNWRTVGVLSVDAEPDEVMNALLKFRYWAIGLVVMGILISIILSFPIAAMVTRPIKALILATKAVAKGDFAHRVDIPGRTELGDLAQAFNLMTEGLHEREMYKTQFERYVSHQVARKILSNPAKSFWAAERRRVTVLFCDIRGFTALVERQDPEEVISQLNRFFSEMIDIVFQYEGTLDKFMGDAIMAVFGAPLSSGVDEERAMRAALDMQKKVVELNAQWSLEGIQGFRIGIGINTGDVVIGNIGSERRMEYSAIGDTVNTAARLEALNKEYGTSLLISETTYKAVSKLVQVRFISTETLRGRVSPIGVYEVTGLRDPEREPNMKSVL